MSSPPINRLAEETISTILSLALDIPATMFRSLSTDIWGENDHVSTSEVLLVSKQWLRIGTRFFYETVVIRSPGQAHALADVLQSHPEFGLYIKQVRLEGAYGSLYPVFECCKNLETLFWSIWDIASTDNIDGLCRSLKVINPTTVLLDDVTDRWRPNANSARLLRTLCEAIPEWTRLVGVPIIS
ncbi:hypothetical protein JB92DRAFT_2813280 [Gautieria morchelliformis]|nr:hypothetical protein JB92DRAFT_2813280 [Gautieria morchelliformis]